MEAQDSRLAEDIEWFLDHLKVERGASPHTTEAYANDLKLAAAFFQGIGIDDWRSIEAPHLLRYESSLGHPLARSTAQRRISSLRSMLKFLKRNNAGPKADLPSTGGFRKPKTLPKALPQETLERLLALADTTKPNGLRDRALMELIYGAGLRVSEACELEQSALDLEERAVRITGKRGKTRRVPLPAETAHWLDHYLREARPQLVKRASGRVFISDTGRNLRRQTAYERLAHYAAAAGLPDGVSPHTLRHTYAVHLLRGGADLRVVQELLGHESIATTQVYTQLDMDEVKAKYLKAHPRA
ncbi:MAG: tyrosine recombinase [Fimbriimonas sp.]